MTADQGALFDTGDATGDALTYRTDDGATVTAPSLFQQGDAPTADQARADRIAADQVAHHRATIAANGADVDLATAPAPISDDPNQ